MKFLTEFNDDTFPFVGISVEKHAARAFVIDKHNHIALLSISGDYQGNSFSFYTTPGGGIEKGETPEMAVKREIMEELGLECSILHEVGIIIDYYNDQKRKTISYYFIVEITKENQPNMTDKEKEIIKNVEWMNIETAIQLLENRPLDYRGKMIQRRDLHALREVMKII